MAGRTQFTLGTLFFIIGVAVIDCLVLRVLMSSFGDEFDSEDDAAAFFGLAIAVTFFCSLFAYLGYVAHFIIRVVAERRRVRCYAINVPSEATSLTQNEIASTEL